MNNLTHIDEIEAGEFFAVKFRDRGDVAYKKQEPGEQTHTRVWDGVFEDPTWGDGTEVLRLTKAEAMTLAEGNRFGAVFRFK